MREEPALAQLHFRVARRLHRAEQPVPRIRRKADLPRLRDFRAEAALAHVVPRGVRRLSAHELLMEKFRRLRVQREQPAPQIRALVVRLRHLGLGDFDVRLVRQFAHRGREVHVLVIHHEAEHRSARAAAEAFENLPVRIHVERRRALVVKRAQRLERPAHPAQGEIPADHLHDVVRGGDLLDDFLWDLRHFFREASDELAARRVKRGTFGNVARNLHFPSA